MDRDELAELNLIELRQEAKAAGRVTSEYRGVDHHTLHQRVPGHGSRHSYGPQLGRGRVSVEEEDSRLLTYGLGWPGRGRAVRLPILSQTRVPTELPYDLHQLGPFKKKLRPRPDSNRRPPP